MDLSHEFTLQRIRKVSSAFRCDKLTLMEWDSEERAAGFKSIETGVLDQPLPLPVPSSVLVGRCLNITSVKLKDLIS